MNVIAHNLSAMNASRAFNTTTKSRAKSSEKLSSGYKINRAADDAASLSISEKMRRQIRGLNQGGENIQDGISLIQVADGALAEVQEMLNRMTELSVQAANGTNSNEDRHYLQQEIQELVAEINRIGKSTTFNDKPLFDDYEGTGEETSITSIISSPAADTGYLTEAYKINSSYYPSASIDFSGINSSNINKLNNQGFSFNCSQNCNEVFDFKFKTDGTPSSASNLSRQVTHNYILDISDCKNGSDVVNKLYSFVQANPPRDNGAIPALTSGALSVSHSNQMIKSADGKGIVIFSTSGMPTKEAAQSAFPKPSYPKSGRIDCSSLTNLYQVNKINNIRIQCSSEEDDCIMINTNRMNATLIGVNNIDISSQSEAKNAIGKIKKASEIISSDRSELGAYQNRLEHSHNNVKNIEENTQAAESQLRDTDMAKEMVKFANDNILAQAGTTMLAQANQVQGAVLKLLE